MKLELFKLLEVENPHHIYGGRFSGDAINALQGQVADHQNTGD